MLVLHRTVADANPSDPRESDVVINVGGVLITVRVVTARGGRVKVGVIAPRGVKILRAELLDREPSPAKE